MADDEDARDAAEAVAANQKIFAELRKSLTEGTIDVYESAAHEATGDAMLGLQDSYFSGMLPMIRNFSEQIHRHALHRRPRDDHRNEAIWSVLACIVDVGRQPFANLGRESDWRQIASYKQLVEEELPSIVRNRIKSATRTAAGPGAPASPEEVKAQPAKRTRGPRTCQVCGVVNCPGSFRRASCPRNKPASSDSDSEPEAEETASSSSSHQDPSQSESSSESRSDFSEDDDESASQEASASARRQVPKQPVASTSKAPDPEPAKRKRGRPPKARVVRRIVQDTDEDDDPSDAPLAKRPRAGAQDAHEGKSAAPDQVPSAQEAGTSARPSRPLAEAVRYLPKSPKLAPAPITAPAASSVQQPPAEARTVQPSSNVAPSAPGPAVPTAPVDPPPDAPPAPRAPAGPMLQPPLIGVLLRDQRSVHTISLPLGVEHLVLQVPDSTSDPPETLSLVTRADAIAFVRFAKARGQLRPFTIAPSGTAIVTATVLVSLPPVPEAKLPKVDVVRITHPNMPRGGMTLDAIRNQVYHYAYVQLAAYVLETAPHALHHYRALVPVSADLLALSASILEEGTFEEDLNTLVRLFEIGAEEEPGLRGTGWGEWKGERYLEDGSIWPGLEACLSAIAATATREKWHLKKAVYTVKRLHRLCQQSEGGTSAMQGMSYWVNRLEQDFIKNPSVVRPEPNQLAPEPAPEAAVPDVRTIGARPSEKAAQSDPRKSGQPQTQQQETEGPSRPSVASESIEAPPPKAKKADEQHRGVTPRSPESSPDLPMADMPSTGSHPSPVDPVFERAASVASTSRGSKTSDTRRPLGVSGDVGDGLGYSASQPSFLARRAARPSKENSSVPGSRAPSETFSKAATQSPEQHSRRPPALSNIAPSAFPPSPIRNEPLSTPERPGSRQSQSSLAGSARASSVATFGRQGALYDGSRLSQSVVPISPVPVPTIAPESIVYDYSYPLPTTRRRIPEGVMTAKKDGTSVASPQDLWYPLRTLLGWTPVPPGKRSAFKFTVKASDWKRMATSANITATTQRNQLPLAIFVVFQRRDGEEDDTAWPDEFRMHVNRKNVVKDFLRGRIWKRSAWLITNLSKEGENEVVFPLLPMVEVPEDLEFAIQVGVGISVPYISSWVESRWYNVNRTHELVQRTRGMGPTVISVDDPIVPGQKIQMPVRGTTCNHPEVFDLATFLKAQQATFCPWKCPICGNLLSPTTLERDSSILSLILNEARSTAGQMPFPHAQPSQMPPPPVGRDVKPSAAELEGVDRKPLLPTSSSS